MGYDYMNMSDYDCLTELVEPPEDYRQTSRSDIICINDTRFIAELLLGSNYFPKLKNDIEKLKRKYYRQMLLQTNSTY